MPVNVTTLVAVLYAVTVAIPEASIPDTASWSPVLIPATESRRTVDTPDAPADETGVDSPIPGTPPES